MKSILAIIMVLFSSLAMAWPTKEITMILPFPAGGWGEQVGRIFAREIEREFKVPVIWKSMPGAGHGVAVSHIMSQANDHHTFMQATEDLIITQMANNTKLYEEFKPVSIWATFGTMVFGGPGSSLELFKKQITDGANVNFGNMGANSGYHYWTVNLKSNLKITPVPYKGSVPLITDVMGRHVEYGVGNLVSAHNLIAAGKLVPIMVGTERRHPLYKDVPTFKELGFKGDAYEGWFGLVTKKDTDPVAIERISAVVRRTVSNDPKMQEQSQRGINLVNFNVAEGDRFYANSINESKKLIP